MNNYYGRRYYNPAQGRWIGRDAATNDIILNYYQFCHNSPLIRLDRDGRDDLLTTMVGVAGAGALGAMNGFAIQQIFQHYLTGSFVFAGVQGNGFGGAGGVEALLYGGADADDGLNGGFITGPTGSLGGFEGTPGYEASYSQYGGGFHAGDVAIAGFESDPVGFGAVLNSEGSLGIFVYTKIFGYAFVGAGVDIDPGGNH